MKRESESQLRDVLIRASSLHWFHWVIISFSALLTIFAWNTAKIALNQTIETEFNRQTDQLISQVKQRVSLYENALWGVSALMELQDGQLNEQQWSKYAERLNSKTNYPGLTGMGIIFNVKKIALEPFLAEQRVIRPNFSIHPSIVQTEDEYWPVTYIYPLEPNKQAIGLNAAFESNRYSTIKKVRDTGLAQLTAPLILVQDQKETPGLVLYVPFYKAGSKIDNTIQRKDNIIGISFAPLIISNLMKGFFHLLSVMKVKDYMLISIILKVIAS